MVKRRWRGLIAGSLILLMTASGWAAPATPSLIATPPQPKWSDLNVKQKIVLAPLSDDWDSLEFFRQKKWLALAEHFPQMSPEEQRRVQAQMQEWGKLTPEQRQLARENFKTANRLTAEKKQELKQKWEEYSNLPEEEKEKLKRQAESKPPAKPLAAAQSSASAVPLFAPTLAPAGLAGSHGHASSAEAETPAQASSLPVSDGGSKP